MGKAIAVQGCTLTLGAGTGSIQITTPPSAFMTADGSAVYAGTLSILVSGYTGGPVSGAAPVPGTITPGAVFNKLGGQALVLEGDKSAPMTFVDPKTGATTVDTVTISYAGQVTCTAD